MLKNYLKIAARNILKNKVYSTINIVGLSVGIAVSILILLYVQNELTFDSFNKNKDRIYRVITEQEKKNERMTLGVSPLPLGPSLVSEFPQIKSTARFLSRDAIISVGDNKFVQRIVFTDSSFFSMFSFSVINGNLLTALKQPNSVVLTERTAKKLFCDENPLSKLLEININNNKKNFVVTAVVQNIPNNSSIDFDILLPIVNTPEYEHGMEDWTSFGTSTFILLSNNAQIADVEKSISPFIKKYFGRYISDGQTTGWLDK